MFKVAGWAEQVQLHNPNVFPGTNFDLQRIDGKETRRSFES